MYVRVPGALLEEGARRAADIVGVMGEKGGA